MASPSFSRINGLIAAPFTPFSPDYSLNLDVVPKIAEHLVRQNVAGAFVGGSTGEWASLTLEERKALAVAWRKAASRDFSLIVHVGHNTLEVCRELASHAEQLGVRGIAALMPSYFRPPTIKAAVEFCREIAAAAPRTPFYYYHIPDMTGVNFPMEALLPEISRRVPSFAGIKFTHSDLLDYGLTLADAAGRFEVFFGRDEVLLSGLALGATSAVGSTYNYAANLYHRIMKAHAAGRNEEARQHQIYVQRLVRLIIRHGSFAAGKAMMAFEGVDCGPVRPPLVQMDSKSLRLLKDELLALDFFREAGVLNVSS